MSAQILSFATSLDNHAPQERAPPPMHLCWKSSVQQFHASFVQLELASLQALALYLAGLPASLLKPASSSCEHQIAPKRSTRKYLTYLQPVPQLSFYGETRTPTTVEHQHTCSHRNRTRRQ